MRGCVLVLFGFKWFVEYSNIWTMSPLAEYKLSKMQSPQQTPAGHIGALHSLEYRFTLLHKSTTTLPTASANIVIPIIMRNSEKSVGIIFFFLIHF